MTETEYHDALKRLHESLPFVHADEAVVDEGDTIAEAENRLWIDFSLGEGFPESRRAELMTIHRYVAERRTSIMQAFLQKKLSSGEYAVHLQQLSEAAAQAFSTVLTKAEYRAFLGDVEEMLPLDPSLIQR